MALVARDDKAEYVKILLDFSIGMSFVLIEYYSTRPHEWKLLKMKAAQNAMMFSQRMAGYWWDKAVHYATLYNGMKN